MRRHRHARRWRRPARFQVAAVSSRQRSCQSSASGPWQRIVDAGSRAASRRRCARASRISRQRCHVGSPANASTPSDEHERPVRRLAAQLVERVDRVTLSGRVRSRASSTASCGNSRQRELAASRAAAAAVAPGASRCGGSRGRHEPHLREVERVAHVVGERAGARSGPDRTCRRRCRARAAIVQRAPRARRRSRDISTLSMSRLDLAQRLVVDRPGVAQRVQLARARLRSASSISRRSAACASASATRAFRVRRVPRRRGAS